MNAQQIESALRVVLAAGGPIAALVIRYTEVSQDDFLLWVQVVLLVVPPLGAWLWGYLAHTPAAQIQRTQSLSEVATVVVRDDARGKVGELAASPQFPGVVTETQNARQETAVR